MTTRRPVLCRVGERPPAAASGEVYGRIGGDDPPILIVGRRTDAVTHVSGSSPGPSPAPVAWPRAPRDVTRRHPLPDPDGPITVFASWLPRPRRATTIPWFAILDDEVAVAR